MTNGSPDELYKRAKAALRRGLETCGKELNFDQHGLASRLEDNLLEGVTPSLFEADFQADGGEEMRGEMRAPHASSALAVNAFSPWRADPHLLRFAEHHGFARFSFEQQLPTAFGGVPAYFDAFASVGGDPVGVEIKCLEYLTRPSPKYLQGFTETIESAYARHGPGGTGWLGLVSQLKTKPEAFGVLFAAQLVKQALALAGVSRPRASLVYLYWEPSNWSEFELFRQHRAELADLAQKAAGDRVGFAYQSFTTLFHQWSRQPEPSWLSPHAKALLSRYDVAI
jgi:hypothetical protein